MVTQNPSSSISPTTPTKKLWRPKAHPAEGVPSMFAHATLTKPLKVNAATTKTIRRSSKKTPPPKAESSQKKTSKSPPPSKAESYPKKSKTKIEPKKRSSTDKAPSTSTQATKPKRSSFSSAKKVKGFGSTVCGTPQSWPKPHDVKPEDKPKIKPKKKSIHPFGKPIDDLIPDMYKRKSAKQLQEEQAAEIETMRKIMFALRQQERERQERALQPTPIVQDLENVLGALRAVKEESDDLDDHSSLNSDATPEELTAYSKHMKSKLSLFNSNHAGFESSSDDSSVSSWDSDSSDDDDLFRGY